MEAQGVGTARVWATATDGSKVESTACTITVSPLVEGNGVHMGHEYVDLGVVVGGKTILWAKTNIGATKPADCGDLSTSPNAIFDYDADGLEFGSTFIESGGSFRFYGHSVRPVCQ